MNTRAAEVAVIAGGLAYLLALGWAIGNTSFDVWGALIVVPVYGVIGVVFARWMFQGDLAALAVPMAWGLVFKLGGTLGRYWVGFEAYDGLIDAGRYHNYAAEAATKVWRGQENLTTVLPQGQGTPFLENFTAFVYTFTGTSQVAGFMTFAMLSYIGVAFMVKAAAIAVPGLEAKRYAWLCVVFPSIAYWPSSIGKEAAVMLGLGLATYGIAKVLTHGQWVTSLAFIGAGLGFAALIRPHMAGIWVAGALPALVVAFLRRPAPASGSARRSGANRFGIVMVLVLATVGMSVIASVTVQYLAPSSSEEASTTDSLTAIIERTSNRTSQAGSSFTPPSVSSPASWPYASVRTLVRPLPHEVNNLAQAVAAAEIVALLALLVLTRRRLANLPRLLVTSPYVTFAVTTLFVTGLAYASLANLGILTRQKSLVFPLLLLLVCLPPRATPPSLDRAGDDEGATPGMDHHARVADSAAARRDASGRRATAPVGGVRRSTPRPDHLGLA